MTETPNIDNSNEAVVGSRNAGVVPREPIRIDQFWDKNRLVWPWMEDYLPVNRMLADGIATVMQLF